MCSGLRIFINQLDTMQLAQFHAKHLKEIIKLKTDKAVYLDINILFSTDKKTE